MLKGIELRKTMKEFELTPGHVLNLSKIELYDLFDEINIDLEDEKYAIFGTSASKRLKAFLSLESDENINIILTELRKLK